VTGHQLGLRLGNFRKLRLQDLGNALMVLLPRTPEQRLIRRVLDQGVLEEVRRLRRESPLVEELRRNQLVQPLLQGLLVPRGDGV
jgi:hypothetical protein